MHEASQWTSWCEVGLRHQLKLVLEMSYVGEGKPVSFREECGREGLWRGPSEQASVEEFG